MAVKYIEQLNNALNSKTASTTKKVFGRKKNISHDKKCYQRQNMHHNQGQTNDKCGIYRS